MFNKVRSTWLLAGITTWLVAAVASLAPLSLAVADGITPDILAAAKTEGQVTYYTSADLVLANKLKAAFEASTASRSTSSARARVSSSTGRTRNSISAPTRPTPSRLP